jgi:CheY-like chemotaxis protein
MNGVIGMTSLLFDTPLNPEQREFVGTIRSSGQALLGIINEILDFSQMESGHTEIEHQPVEISQCVEEAVDGYALKAAAKKIEIACHLDPAVPPWILLDMTRLRQVLVSLLDNAVKFTPRGRITIEVRLAPVAPSHTTPTFPPGSNPQLIDFFVSDTGIGVAANHRDRLFKPFSQVDSSNTRKYGGNGLGLAICDRLCQLMGGTIDMRENPGGGSVFRFSILAEPTASPVTSRFAPLPRAMQQAKILLVDDLPLNRLTLSQSLAPFQLTVIEAATLAAGRQLAQQHTISAAIIDQELGDENGQTLVGELLTYQPELPIILLTNPTDSAAKKSAKDPANLVRIPKPIRPFLILETIHRLLSTTSSAAPIIIPSLNTAPVSSPTRTPVASAPTPLSTSIPLRILIAEDNLVNQKVALRFLARLGYQATVANNGREALQILDEQSFDLVLMDMQMPEMDGLTATREIRKRYPAPRQPIIFALTANAVTGDRERCLESGMNDYLSKPVKMESIEQLIKKHFRPRTP